MGGGRTWGGAAEPLYREATLVNHFAVPEKKNGTEGEGWHARWYTTRVTFDQGDRSRWQFESVVACPAADVSLPFPASVVSSTDASQQHIRECGGDDRSPNYRRPARVGRFHRRVLGVRGNRVGVSGRSTCQPQFFR